MELFFVVKRRFHENDLFIKMYLRYWGLKTEEDSRRRPRLTEWLNDELTDWRYGWHAKAYVRTCVRTWGEKVLRIVLTMTATTITTMLLMMLPQMLSTKSWMLMMLACTCIGVNIRLPHPDPRRSEWCGWEGRNKRSTLSKGTSLLRRICMPVRLTFK